MNVASGSCMSIRLQLNAFADGELRGDSLRAVSTHLENCPKCADEIAEIGSVGGLLRQGAEIEAEPADLAGLADGVVSRIRAEEHESWRGKLSRATDDLHWVLAGVGSVAAAFVSALVVSAVVQSGVGQRPDSLAALLNTLATAPPELGSGVMGPASLALLSTENVQLASLAEVNDDGHVLSLEMLSTLDSEDAAILRGELRRLRFQQHVDRRMTDPSGRRFVWLFSATEVRPTGASFIF